MNVLFIGLLLNLGGYEGHLSGRVVSQSLNPLPNVRVCLSAWDCSCTDRHGRFTFTAGDLVNPSQAKQLHLSRRGYESVIVPIDSTDPIETELAESSDPAWSVPICPASLEEGLELVGGNLKIAVPSGRVADRWQDTDYACTSIRIPFRRGRLAACGGPHWSYGPPDVRQAVVQGSRDLDLGQDGECGSAQPPELSGVDIRGFDSQGKYWRFIGGALESLEYHTRSKRTAAIFDRYLDSLCFSKRP
ncbi:MAG: hypothetical protein K0U98_10510 [Deltaproteobacteria bacterium]|nr:hypothetical protein [Deltaproteobacteria bacterium]